MTNPRVMDIKIGFKTTINNTTEKKATKALIQSLGSTTSLFGFRLTGVSIKDDLASTKMKYSKPNQLKSFL